MPAQNLKLAEAVLLVQLTFSPPLLFLVAVHLPLPFDFILKAFVHNFALIAELCGTKFNLVLKNRLLNYLCIGKSLEFSFVGDHPLKLCDLALPQDLRLPYACKRRLLFILGAGIAQHPLRGEMGCELLTLVFCEQLLLINLLHQC